MHRNSLSDPQLYGALDELLVQFGSLQEGAQAKKAVAGDILDQFNRLSQQLEAGTRCRVDEQMDRVRLAIDVLTKELWWVSAVVVVISLLLVFIFTYLINHPVRQIESRILSLGAGGEPDPQPVDGPAELVLLGDRICSASSWSGLRHRISWRNEKSRRLHTLIERLLDFKRLTQQ